MDLRSRTGLQVNPGNVYRELAKLSSQGMIDAMENPRDADVRRNPYAISERGRRAFDEWLRTPAIEVDELASWLSFLDRVPPAELPGLLERLQERLWLRSKTLARDREDVMAKARANGHPAHAQVAAARSLFQVKLVSAVLEFVEELQRSPALGDDAPRRQKR